MDKRFIDLNVLKCEVLYLFGIMILLLESKFPGTTKENIFVAYYRSGLFFKFFNNIFFIFRADVQLKNLELLLTFLRNRKEPYETCLS